MHLQNAEEERIFRARGVGFEAVDGSDPADRDLRNLLFEISGRRAEYPQVFFRSCRGNYTFVGGHEEVQQANEISGMLKENSELEANPEVMERRFEHMFKHCSSMLPLPSGSDSGSSLSQTQLLAASFSFTQ